MTDVFLLLHDDKKVTTPGTTVKWCEKRELTYKVVSVPEEIENLSDAFKALIVFGGDMEAFSEAKHAWLQTEKLFLRRAIESGKAIFGLCLGSQLLAEQLGGTVHPMGEWEIGWYGVHLMERDEPLMPLHWHESYFSLPPEAQRIATNEHCTNQGFAVGEKLVGFQFHCEIDHTRVDHALDGYEPNCRGHVQAPSEIRELAARYMPPLQDWYFARLDRWWKSIAQF